MSFGSDLQEQFHFFTKGKDYSEVELFIKLQDAFYCLQREYCGAIDIIHGNRCQVKFELSHTTSYPHVIMKDFNGALEPSLPKSLPSELYNFYWRELADIMFVVYNEHEMRYMFLQNKKAKCIPDGAGLLKFEAEMGQLLLLTFRPEILSAKGSSAMYFFDNGSLKDAILPSVGSYGVFYKLADSFDMQYYPANRIQYNNTKCKKQTVSFEKDSFGKLPFDEKRYAVAGHETIGTKTLDRFGDELIGLSIGTPVDPSTRIGAVLVSLLLHKSDSFKNSKYYINYIHSQEASDASNNLEELTPYKFIIAIDADKILHAPLGESFESRL